MAERLEGSPSRKSHKAEMFIQEQRADHMVATWVLEDSLGVQEFGLLFAQIPDMWTRFPS